jgi:hypothetical protein
MLALHERESRFHFGIAPFVQGCVVAIDTAPKRRHLQMAAALLQEEFYGLDDAASLLHAQVLFQTAHALVHWALNLEDDRDAAVQLHYDGFVSGLRQAIRERGGPPTRLRGSYLPAHQALKLPQAKGPRPTA